MGKTGSWNVDCPCRAVARTGSWRHLALSSCASRPRWPQDVRFWHNYTDFYILFLQREKEHLSSCLLEWKKVIFRTNGASSKMIYFYWSDIFRELSLTTYWRSKSSGAILATLSTSFTPTQSEQSSGMRRDCCSQSGFSIKHCEINDVNSMSRAHRGEQSLHAAEWSSRGRKLNFHSIYSKTDAC